MIQPDIPIGFGGIRLRGEFLFRLGDGKYVPAIKTSTHSAILCHCTRAVNRKLSYKTVVLTDRANLN